MVFRKHLLLLYCFIAFFSKGMAQSVNPGIGVLEFKAMGVDSEDAQKVSRYIETAFHRTNRFKVLTRQLIDAIDAERKAQKENIDNLVIEQGKAIGAEYIVKGTVSRFSKNVNRATDREGKPTSKIYTSTQVTYTIKIIAVKSGIIMARDTYKGSLNGIDHHIKNFIRAEFPYDFTILEMIKKKGDKNPEFVLLDGGFKQGLIPGLIFHVYEIHEENINGTIIKREVKIGDLFLKKLDTSGHFALCSISRGKRTIFEKLESGVRLECKVPKKYRFLGMDFEYEY